MPAKRLLLIGLAVAAFWLPARGPAQHAPPPDEHGQPATHAPAESTAHGADAHGEANKPALLQFDPGSAIWTIIVFALLLLALRLVAWKPILRVLQEREAFILRSIEDAKADRAKAEQLLDDYRAQLDKSRDEAAAIVEDGRRDAEGVRQRILEQARTETAEMTVRARREIQLATEAAVRELYDRTAELSVQVAGRIISKELSRADHDRLIADSLSAIQGEGKAKQN